MGDAIDPRSPPPDQIPNAVDNAYREKRRRRDQQRSMTVSGREHD